MLKHAILGLVGALALLGCGGGGGGNGRSTRPRVAYINASPDAGSLDFLLNGDTKASTVPFGTATEFERIDAKDYDVAVKGIDSEEEIWTEAHTFSSDTDNLVIAVGLRNPPVDNTQTPPVTELDKRLILTFNGGIDRIVPTGNRARLIVVNGFVRQAGFGTPPVDFRSPGDTPLVNVANLALGASATTTVDSGAQTFVVRQNGTEQEFVSETNFNLNAGSIYIALISGVEGGTGAATPAIRLIPITPRDP